VRVLVLNVGSSSVKGSIVESRDGSVATKQETTLGTDVSSRQRFDRLVGDLLARLRASETGRLAAVGHRVVHGGTRYRAAVRIDERVVRGIEDLAEFAPLHNQMAARGIRAARKALPGIPQIAAFDTAFHAGLAEEQYLYPVPWQWHREFGIRRFGFHGLSVEWSTGQAAEMLGRPASDLALIVAHLGSGCSVTAVLGGRSVATSMGLTPLEGLMMGTRAGSIDPGILFYMLRTRRAGWRQLERTLDHESGLAGVYGKAAGMREIEVAATGGNRRARLAIDMFVSRAAAGIAAAAISLPRVDALVFTGGIGEHSATVRNGIVSKLARLAIGTVLRVEAREDAVIASQAARLLQQ
jgi:acetate kinase